MAVAKKQIVELLEVTLKHVSEEELEGLLRAYKRTTAYKNNKSFRDTIKRLREEIRTYPE